MRTTEPDPTTTLRLVTCRAEGAEVTVLDHDAQRMLYMIRYTVRRGDTVAADAWKDRLISRLIRAEEVEITCPFTGEVWIDIQNGVERWQCPLCGTDHELPMMGF